MYIYPHHIQLICHAGNLKWLNSQTSLNTQPPGDLQWWSLLLILSPNASPCVHTLAFLSAECLKKGVMHHIRSDLSTVLSSLSKRKASWIETDITLHTLCIFQQDALEENTWPWDIPPLIQHAPFEWVIFFLHHFIMDLLLMVNISANPLNLRSKAALCSWSEGKDELAHPDLSLTHATIYC